MPRHYWTQDQTAWLCAAAQPRALTLAQLTARFNARFQLALRQGQIGSKARALGLHWRRGDVRAALRNYQPAEIAWLVEHAKGKSLEAIQAGLAHVFGAHHGLPSLKAALGNRGIRTGRDTRFQRGQKVWNAGTKGATGKNRTTFRPGNVPASIKPLGTTRRSRDGYIEIKVAQPNPWTGCPTRYRPLHLVNWEAAHGPVPPQHAVLFVDGDKNHCALDNLRCVHRGVLGILAKNGWHKLPVELREAAIATAQLILATSQRAKRRTPTPQSTPTPTIPLAGGGQGGGGMPADHQSTQD